MPRDGLAGRLLVATPALRDPNFDRTVVLLLEHGDDGALGVVLNRPSNAGLDDPLEGWRERAAAPAVVFVGGPVRQEAAICLARSDHAEVANGWQPLFDQLGTLDLGLTPDDIGVPVDRLRVFAGYASWGAAQLEAEIEAGAWYVLDAAPGDALSAEPSTLWRTVLHRQPGPLGAVANFPADLALN